jgi:hypothetical protein
MTLAFAMVLIFARCGPAKSETALDSAPILRRPAENFLHVQGANPALESGDLVLGEIEDLRELPTGAWVTGMRGDVLLGNSKLRCVFANPVPPPDDPERAGILLDLCRADVWRDSLVASIPTHGRELGIHMKTTGLTLRAEGYPNNAAAVVLTQESLEIQGLRAVTEYILEPGSNGLRMVTTWHNNTTGTLTGLEVGDLLQWGGIGGFLPGVGALNPEKLIEGQSDYLAALGSLDTYTLAAKKGKISVAAQQNVLCAISDTVEIALGGSARVERTLFVGDRDMAALGEQVYKYQQLPYGWILGRLGEVNRSREGSLIEMGPIAGGEVQVIAGKRDGKLVNALPYARTYTNAQGEFLIPLPVGTWHIRGNVPGHILPDPIYGLEVRANQTTPRDLTVGPASQLHVRVVDSATSQPIPSKITVESMINTAPVDFGPPDTLKGNNACYLANGHDTLKLPAGNYKVVASRGIEYEAVEKIVRVRPGESQSLELALRRTVPTPGWISVDLGVRTNRSRGCLVSPEDRVVAAAAEGVEYLVTGDEEYATDLSEAVRSLGLENSLRTAVGMRIQATGENPLGVFLVFPVPADAPPPPPPPSSSAPAYFSRLRELFPESLLSVCRPVFPDVGYYSLFGWKAEKPRLPDSRHFSRDFDLLEVWEGKRAAARSAGMGVYWTELFHGRRPGLVAVSNSGGMQNEEVGSPRTYVQVLNDNLPEVSEKEILESLKAGRVILTNGPFVDVKVEGKGPGSLVKAVDGYVNVEMKVWAANWVSTYSYQIDQDGSFLRTIMHPGVGSREPLRYPRAEMNDKTTLQIRCSKDCVLTFIIMGSQPLSPVISPFGRGEEGQVYPYAITGPIFVDADGDGRCTPAIPPVFLEEENDETVE